MGPVGAEEVPRDLPIERVIGRIAAAPRDQPKVFAAPFELMFGQVVFPIRGRTRKVLARS